MCTTCNSSKSVKTFKKKTVNRPECIYSLDELKEIRDQLKEICVKGSIACNYLGLVNSQINIYGTNCGIFTEQISGIIRYLNGEM